MRRRVFLKRKNFASLLPCELCAKRKKSRGWGFWKVEAAFSYFLFPVHYSLFPCVFVSLCLRGNKNVQKVQYVQWVQKVVSIFQLLTSLFYKKISVLAPSSRKKLRAFVSSETHHAVAVFDTSFSEGTNIARKNLETDFNIEAVIGLVEISLIRIWIEISFAE